MYIHEAGTLSFGMSEMAAKYPNDMISNALARVARKLEYYNKPFSEPLTTLDMEVISFYRSNVK